MFSHQLFSKRQHLRPVQIYPCPKQQILDPSKLKESADDNFEFDENGRELLESVENTVGKGEIGRYEFSKGLYGRHLKSRACLGKG